MPPDSHMTRSKCAGHVDAQLVDSRLLVLQFPKEKRVEPLPTHCSCVHGLLESAVMGFEACYQLYQGHTTRLVPRRHPPAPPRSLFFFVLVTFELLLSSSWYLQFRFLDFLSVQKIPI